MSEIKKELKVEELENVSGGHPPLVNTDGNPDKKEGPFQLFPVLEGLNDEDLEGVNGGTFTERTLYYINQFMKAVSAKYEAWNQPSYSKEERLQMIQVFVKEIYDSLSEEGKKAIDEFKEEYPLLWEQTFERIAY